MDSTESIATIINISSKQLNWLARMRALEYIGSRGSLAIWCPTGSVSLLSSVKAPNKNSNSSDLMIAILFDRREQNPVRCQEKYQQNCPFSFWGLLITKLRGLRKKYNLFGFSIKLKPAISSIPKAFSCKITFERSHLLISGTVDSSSFSNSVSG